jgi:hypothetical protein
LRELLVDLLWPRASYRERKRASERLNWSWLADFLNSVPPRVEKNQRLIETNRPLIAVAMQMRTALLARVVDAAPDSEVVLLWSALNSYMAAIDPQWSQEDGHYECPAWEPYGLEVLIAIEVALRTLHPERQRVGLRVNSPAVQCATAVLHRMGFPKLTEAAVAKRLERIAPTKTSRQGSAY